MSQVTLDTAPYKPSNLIVKITHVPEVLTDHPHLVHLFKQIVEKLAVEVGDTWMPTSLQTYSMPEASSSGVDLSLYSLPEPETKTINVCVAEIKDKRISRTLKEICKICFKEKPVPPSDTVQENVGFDLLMYELDEAGLDVIDAWKLTNFTVPYGINIPLSASNGFGIPEPETGRLCSIPLEGVFFSSDVVIEEAGSLHRFNSESKV